MVALLDREIPAKGIAKLTGLTARQVRKARSGFRPDLAEKINTHDANLGKADALEQEEIKRKHIASIRYNLMQAMMQVQRVFAEEEALWNGNRIPSHEESSKASRACIMALTTHQHAIMLARKYGIFTDYENIKQIKERRVGQLKQRSKSRKQSQKNAVVDAAAVGAVA